MGLSLARKSRADFRSISCSSLNPKSIGLLSDDPASAERRDLGGWVAEIGEHGVGVLSQLRGRRAEGGRGIGQLDRIAERREAAALAVVDLEDHAAMRSEERRVGKGGRCRGEWWSCRKSSRE